MDNDLIVIKNGKLELQVTVSNNRENVWLSKKQIAELFEKDRTTISRHMYEYKYNKFFRFNIT